MVGLGKPKLCTKFEVPNFSHCVNIQGEPPNTGEIPQPRATLTLSSACDFMMGLGKSQLRAKFEIASPSCCRNIIENPKFGGAPLDQGQSHFSLGVIL